MIQPRVRRCRRRAPDAVPGLSDPERWVELYGDYLFKYAMMRLRDASGRRTRCRKHFLAALKGGKSFAGRSAEKGWLVGILKNKISDHYRKAGRKPRSPTWSFTRTRRAADLSRTACSRTVGFTNWGLGNGPIQARVWTARCSGKPSAIAPKQAAKECRRRVFTLREVDGIESREICAMLNISESNLWVMLHRARMALRRCLETNWFAKDA